jgi:hypothetical protein
LRLLTQKNSAFAREIFFGEFAALAATSWEARFDLAFDSQESAVGVPKKNQTHHRQEIFVAGKIRIRA